METSPSAFSIREAQFIPPPQAIVLSNPSTCGSLSVTKTTSNGQSGQYFRKSMINGPRRSAYLSQDPTTTVQSLFTCVYDTLFCGGWQGGGCEEANRGLRGGKRFVAINVLAYRDDCPDSSRQIKKFIAINGKIHRDERTDLSRQTKSFIATNALTPRSPL